MQKSDGIEILGGSARAAAAAIGVSPQAVSDWPEQLPARISDRVVAAWARQHLSNLLPEILRGEPQQESVIGVGAHAN